MSNIIRIISLAMMLCVALILVYQVHQWERAEETDRCQAAQQIILYEAELIAACGKLHGEQVTDRWKKLLGGCNE